MRQPTPNILDDVLSAPKPPTMLASEAIKIDGGTQMRAGIDENTVSEYAAIFQDSRQWGNFPPVVVFYDGENHWLADGFHRVAAWKRSGNAQIGVRIPADVRAGTRRDAILYAAGANADHGLRRSDEDKRRAVETLLRDDEWSKWSNRELARRCNVSEALVRKIKNDLGLDTAHETQYTHPKTGQQTTMNTANIGANRPISNLQSPSRRYDSGLPALDMPMPQSAGASVVASDATHTRQQGAPLGRCRVCNRPLYDPELAARGIGACCAAKAAATHLSEDGAPAESDMRPERIAALIELFRNTISKLNEYGDLTGKFTDTLAAQRELEKLIRCLERELALSTGQPVEGWAE